MRCVTLCDAIRSSLPCFGAIYLLLLHTLEVQSLVQNVTRGESDTFINPDKKCNSNSCWEYKNIPIGGNSMHFDDCRCSCRYGYTFVVHNITCVNNRKLQLILLKSLPGKDASFYVTKANYCPSIFRVSRIPTIDITRASDSTLCLINTDYITDCRIIKKDSFYFYQGKWYPIWPPNKQQNTFNITDGFGNIVLQWKPLGKQFAGLIFGLKISCHSWDSGDSDETVKSSYLIFKSAGSHHFNGVKPTLAPSGDNVPSSPSTTQSSTTASPPKSDKDKNSSEQQDDGLISGLVIAAILVILVIVAVVVFFLRRKRNNEEASTGAKSEANPTYEMGQDKSLPVRVSGQTPTYDSPDTSSRYQPLVQNTRMRDASGKVPVYTPLNRQTRDDKQPAVQMKTTDKGELAYESVAIPIQHPKVDNSAGVEESPDYEDPANPTIPNKDGLYAVVSDQDGNTIDFQNTAYADPDSILPCN